jgi:hypothetical protein
VRPAGANDPAKDGIGAWESSGILDVSSLFDIPAGETLLVANVQAHSITGGPIAEQQLVQGGQLLWIRRPG